MDGQEKVGPSVLNLDSGPYNSTSMNSMMQSPTTLPAHVVAETFPTQPGPSRRFTVSKFTPDGNGGWYNCSETPVAYCDSPIARYCTGHCRTNGLQRLSDKADVVRFQVGSPFATGILMIFLVFVSFFRFVFRPLKILNARGKVHKDLL